MVEREWEDRARVICIFRAEAWAVAAFVSLAPQIAQDTGAALGRRVVEADEGKQVEWYRLPIRSVQEGHISYE